MKHTKIWSGAVAAVSVALALALPAQAMALSGSLKLSGSTTVQPVATRLASAFHSKNPSVKIAVAGGGSGVGIKDVLAGRVNIGMSSRDLTAAEKSKGARGYSIARDALTIIINPKNGVKNLSAYQVKQIFTGKITNWNQVGGKNAPIVACGRAAGSGTLDYFKEAFLGGLTVNQSSRVKTYASNGLVRTAVANNANAIGYVGMAYDNASVKGVSIGGVAPTVTNARSGKYRYVRYLYFVTKGAPSSLANAFIAFARSTAGQNIVATEYLKLK
jgi:phosphate transport system substrate-binding protein